MVQVYKSHSGHIDYPGQTSHESAPGRKYPTHLPATALSYNLAETYIIATTIGQALVTVILGARLWTRARPKWRFNIDDYFILLGYLILCSMYGIMISAETHVLSSGRPPLRPVSSIEHSAKLGIISTPIWAWSIGFVKISIACMLLRFQQSKKWKNFLYCMIALNVVGIAFSGFANLFQCTPYRVNWDVLGRIKEKRCWETRSQHVCLYTSSSLHVATDVVYSLLPLTFLRKIRRPRREKAVIAGLMALGLVASGLSLAKAIWGGLTDGWRDKTSVNIMFGLLSCLEVQTAIIAACIPTLRGATRVVLLKLGLRREEEEGEGEGMTRYGEGSSLSGGPRRKKKNGIIRLGRLHISSLKEGSGGRGQGIGNGNGNGIGGTMEIQEIPRQEEMSEASYEMDPKTGRIVCTRKFPVHSSQTNLRDEWEEQRSSEDRHTGHERSSDDRQTDDSGGGVVERGEHWRENAR